MIYSYNRPVFGRVNKICEKRLLLRHIRLSVRPYTWYIQVLRSPKEAFAAVMQSWRERCEKCVCLQGDYVEK